MGWLLRHDAVGGGRMLVALRGRLLLWERISMWRRNTDSRQKDWGPYIVVVVIIVIAASVVGEIDA